MSSKARLSDVFEEKEHQRSILTVTIVAFLVLELLIYLGAAGREGARSHVIISDNNGNVIYETTGSALTTYEKLVFENTFGPLSNYQIHVTSQYEPFPYRGWIAAAVGVPVGLALLITLLVKMHLSLWFGERKERRAEAAALGGKDVGRMGSWLDLFQRLSIFHVGTLVIVAVLLLWMIPNFVSNSFKFSIHTIIEFKWFFISAFAFLALLVTLALLLRYKLSKRMLDNQLELEKFRVEKEVLKQLEYKEPAPLLPEANLEEGERTRTTARVIDYPEYSERH